MNHHDKGRRPHSVTTGPIGASRKLYSSPQGRDDIRVPVREIALDPSAGEPPLRVYDPSGPYTCGVLHARSFRRPAGRRGPGSRRARGWRPTKAARSKPEDNGFVERRPTCSAMSRAAPALSRRRRRACHAA